MKLFSDRTPVSVLSKMAKVLNKYGHIENQCHSLLNKDIIIICAKPSSVYILFYNRHTFSLSKTIFFKLTIKKLM